MQTDTGRIFTEDELEKMFGPGTTLDRPPLGFKRMKTPPTTRQMDRRPPRVGKYDPCPCGSGKKFKWCCYTGPGLMAANERIRKGGQ